MEEYKKQVIDDLKEWVAEGNTEGIKDIDELREVLSDPSMTDSITGNASGSYYCNAYKAQENIDQTHLLWDEEFIDALAAFGCEVSDLLRRGAEVMDVYARCIALENLSDEELREVCKIEEAK